MFKYNEVLQEKNEEDLKDFEEINTLENYNLLKKIDPNDRKIRNYLNFYNKHKKIPNELIKSHEFNKSLRYENSIILWCFMQNTENLREKNNKDNDQIKSELKQFY